MEHARNIIVEYGVCQALVCSHVVGHVLSQTTILVVNLNLVHFDPRY